MERRLSAHERFRMAGRRVLRTPSDAVAHEARIEVAMQLDGSEPLQAALVDMLYACDQVAMTATRWLQREDVAHRLGAGGCAALLEAIDSGRALPRYTTLATRHCILASPSLDVPARVMLCAPDDSRRLADQAVEAILAGGMNAEDAFLDHCEGSLDTLAFMRARQALRRQGHVFQGRWSGVADILSKGVRE